MGSVGQTPVEVAGRWPGVAVVEVLSLLVDVVLVVVVVDVVVVG